MSSKSVLDFPSWSLIPRRETKIDSFMLQHPQYDGSGVIIAVVDSGVDPGAAGLQKTPKDDIKILRRLDCTGCGDIILTEPLESTNGYINGVTGRKLNIPEKWTNPTGYYRVGSKNVYDLYSEEIRQKVQKKYKEDWLRQHTSHFNEANRNLADFEEKNANNTELTNEAKFTKEDIEAKVEVLTNIEKKFFDFGPTYDCVVFHDGSKWNACVDITEQGNLELCKVLGEYNVTHEFTYLTELDHFNYSINVHNDGKVLEFVGTSSLHGTNVAITAAGYFEDGSDKNGIAPGAQIVSLTVSDNRLGSAVTGSALVQAIIAIIDLSKNKPVIIHGSCGVQRAQMSLSTHIGGLINEIIDKYRCIWVADVGHYGPALSTVTSPPSVGQDTIIGVGSFVSPEMMSAVHSLRQKLSGTIYTWSSRGPSVDGGFGVNICAPGDATFSHPSTSHCSSELKECVSVASAYVTGAVALLLSGLVAEEKHFSPYIIKRALENGTTPLEDAEAYAQGHGLLNIENSFEILTTSDSSCELSVRFDISCGPNNIKGIYMFCSDAQACQEWLINIEPKFTEDTAPLEKIEFSLKLVLECSAPFIEYPKYLSIANMSRAISVKVDAKTLKSGVHTTNIQAFNASNNSKGPVFRIPVTVIKAREVDPNNYTYTSKRKVFAPNTIKRYFFKAPENASWAVFNMNCFECTDIGHFTLHCMQILPTKHHKTIETKFDLTVSSNTDNLKSFKVEGGIVLEVTLAKNWNSIGDMSVQYSISFYGIKPNKSSITMLAVEGIQRVDVTTLRGEEILPVVTLNNSIRILESTESKVKPLSARNVIPPGRQIYELVHTYSFSLVKPAEVTLENPYLSEILYQTEYESHMWMIFNSNKQLLSCGDANSTDCYVKLGKGIYTVKSQIRHDKKENLDKLISLPMLLKMKLTNPITMDVHPTYVCALLGEKKTDRFQRSNSPFAVPLFISPLTSEKYNVKTNNNANYLSGTVTFAKDELGKVDSYPIRYILHKYDNNKKNTENKTNNKTKLDEYNEALKDLKNSWMKKIDEAEEVKTLYEEIEQGFPNDLQVHINMLRFLQPIDPKVQLPNFKEDEINKYKVEELQTKVLPLCEKILRNLDQDEILCHFASKLDIKDNVKLQESMKLKKNTLIESLCHKGIALSRLYQYSQTNLDAQLDCKPTKDDISDTWETLCKFVDPKEKNVDASVLLFTAWHAAINKHYGRLLKFLLTYQEEKCSREIDEKCIEICKLLEWHHISNHIQRIIPSKYPKDYKHF